MHRSGNVGVSLVPRLAEVAVEVAGSRRAASPFGDVVEAGSERRIRVHRQIDGGSRHQPSLRVSEVRGQH
eukprot:973560-Alexandrium_andersonii.AAC.1